MTDSAPTTSAGPPPPPGAIVSDPPPGDAAGSRPTATGTLIAPPPPPPGGAPVATPTPPPAAKPGLVGLLAALGVGLLAAAIALSTVRTRADGELDWSNYIVGLGATAALLIVAGAALAVGRRRTPAASDLAAWPGSIGVVGVGFMIGIGLEDQGWVEDWLGYLVGGVIVALAVLGYVAVRRGAFVVAAIFGLAILYVNLFDDLVAEHVSEDHPFIWYAAAVGIFVVAVTVVGWVLPTRALSGVVVGTAGVIGFGLILGSLALSRFFAAGFSDLMAEETGGPTDPDTDVWTILAFAAVLTILWAVGAAVTGHPGFTVLAIAMPVVMVPLATMVLAVERPTWWGVALAGAGAVLLLVGGLRLLAARRKASGW